jgi:hypothetical protein
MSTRKPKFEGKEITVDGRTGVIIYANGTEVLIQFPDKSRTRIPRLEAKFLLDLEEYKLPGEA